MSNSNVPLKFASNGKIPAGKYVARIASCSFDMQPYDIMVYSGAAEEYAVVTMELEIFQGPHAGRCESKNYHVTSHKACQFLRKEFRNIGVELVSLEDLGTACQQVVGKLVKLAINYSQAGNKSIIVTGVYDPAAPVLTAPTMEEIWKN